MRPRSWPCMDSPPRPACGSRYPAWQGWLRKRQPPLQVVWGRYDPSFQVGEAEAYRRDVPDAEVHVLDAGHFALDEQPDVIADLTRRFLLP
jgi:pimeloyl-ACP methyl ester carboxylesterase